MPNNFQILVDSDAFVGRFYRNDPHHEKTLHLFAAYEADKSRLATTNLVIMETATVLSHREGQSLAHRFLTIMERSFLPIIQVDEDLQTKTFEIFKTQTKKGTSMVDCANVAVSRRFQIPEIFSFDKVYPKKFQLPLATD